MRARDKSMVRGVSISERLGVVRSDDSEAIDAILRHPMIGPKLRTDGRVAGYVAHPLVSYWLANVAGAPVGVFTAVAFSQWEVEVHAAILPAGLFAARDLSRLFLDEVFAAQGVQRATAYVLASLPSAANLCRRLGFEDEGRRRADCRVNGLPVDVLVLGMLRENRSHRAHTR